MYFYIPEQFPECNLSMQMWRFEGSRTLAHYLRKKDCVQQLADDMDVPYECAVPLVMKQVLECVAVHSHSSFFFFQDNCSVHLMLEYGKLLKQWSIMTGLDFV